MALRSRMLLFASLTGAVVIASAHAATTTGRPAVTTSLDGKRVLPHRIHWLAYPKLTQGQVKEVDFLIDGQLRWIERKAPYTYGDDGNWLVTSWLTPGVHRFAVRVLTTRRRSHRGEDHRRPCAGRASSTGSTRSHIVAAQCDDRRRTTRHVDAVDRPDRLEDRRSRRRQELHRRRLPRQQSARNTGRNLDAPTQRPGGKRMVRGHQRGGSLPLVSRRRFARARANGPEPL